MNLMIDLETLGTRPGSVILSIAAVPVDSPAPVEYFYRRIDKVSCIDAGLQVDAATVEWWSKQADDVREEAFSGRERLCSVLTDFSAYCASLPSEPIIWGNGADFDNPLLAEAYKHCGLKQPWKYHNSRCYRTLKSLYPNIPFLKPQRAHSALEDAKAQAVHLQMIFNYIRERGALL